MDRAVGAVAEERYPVSERDRIAFHHQAVYLVDQCSGQLTAARKVDVELPFGFEVSYCPDGVTRQSDLGRHIALLSRGDELTEVRIWAVDADVKGGEVGVPSHDHRPESV